MPACGKHCKVTLILSMPSRRGLRSSWATAVRTQTHCWWWNPGSLGNERDSTLRSSSVLHVPADILLQSSCGAHSLRLSQQLYHAEGSPPFTHEFLMEVLGSVFRFLYGHASRHDANFNALYWSVKHALRPRNLSMQLLCGNFQPV